MKKNLLGAAAGLALFVFAGEASATIVTATYSGIITSDETQVFDPISGWQYSTGDLGDPFSLSITFNTEVGLNYYAPGLSEVYGGTDYGSASPVTQMVAKFGGQTFTLGANAESGAILSTPAWGGYYEVYNFGANSLSTYDPGTGNTSYNDVNAFAYVYNYNGNPFSTTDFTTPLSYTPQAGDTAQGALDFQSGVYNNDIGTVSETDRYINFTPTYVTVSAVPEPATWAMMLIGFAGIGVAGMRLRRRAAAVS